MAEWARERHGHVSATVEMSAVEIMYRCTDEAIAVRTEVISTESFVRVSVYLHYA